jgi:hypothetical protein
MPPHVPYGLRGLPFRLWPKCNRLLSLRRPWGAVSCPDEWMVKYEYEIPGGALNLSSTKLPRPWSPWETSPSRKNPIVEPGIEPGYLMTSSQKIFHDSWPKLFLTYSWNLPNHINISNYFKAQQTKLSWRYFWLPPRIDKKCVINQKKAVLKSVVSAKSMVSLYLAAWVDREGHRQVMLFI